MSAAPSMSGMTPSTTIALGRLVATRWQALGGAGGAGTS